MLSSSPDKRNKSQFIYTSERIQKYFQPAGMMYCTRKYAVLKSSRTGRRSQNIVIYHVQNALQGRESTTVDEEV